MSGPSGWLVGSAQTMCTSTQKGNPGRPKDANTKLPEDSTPCANGSRFQGWDEKKKIGSKRGGSDTEEKEFKGYKNTSKSHVTKTDNLTR